jgi:hypothetical protein
MTEHNLIADWRARGQNHKLAAYVEMAARNDSVKQQMLDELLAEVDRIERLADVPMSERARVADVVRRTRRVVASADLSPHPAVVDEMVEEEQS